MRGEDGELTKHTEKLAETKSVKFVVGIDLGTTNSVLAYLSLDASDDFSNVNAASRTPQILEIPQFVAPSTLESRSALPSTLHVGAEEERERADWRLPWNVGDAESSDGAAPNVANDDERAEKEKKKGGFFRKLFGASGEKDDESEKARGTTNPNALYLVGEIASRRAAEEPERTIVSAKSWLVHSKVDRRAPILPWGAPGDVVKVSPVEASRRYLAHLASAWNFAFPDAPIFDQQVVLTVPASFDESARELTREAAIGAGLNPTTLLFLEEPQAAVYSWLSRQGDGWRRELGVGDVVLVCDVGGGTTDLSLIRVEEENGELILNRLAVGDRLLLGGDNMDLALAHRAAALFAAQGTKLNPWQSSALWRQCRDAKEALLQGCDDFAEKNECLRELDNSDISADSDRLDEAETKNVETYKISVLGRSSRMIGDAVSIDFPKADAASIILDGFFPSCSLDERPKRRSSSGLRESGLPFEADPAISRHVAAFLRARADENGETIRPTRFLLNGGVFKSKAIEARFQERLRAWFPDAPPTNLQPDAERELDRAVACGAAYYGLAKKLGGLRIRGASARSYYIGIESAGLAIPGVPRPMKALCVAPIGMEEGTECDVPSEEFELVVGEPAVFRFFSSSTRIADKPGTTINFVDSEFDEGDENALRETDPIETTLESESENSENDDENRVEGSKKRVENGDGEYVATRFHSVVTELGSLEIWCEEVDGPRRWKLEFSVRES